MRFAWAPDPVNACVDLSGEVLSVPVALILVVYDALWSVDTVAAVAAAEQHPLTYHRAAFRSSWPSCGAGLQDTASGNCFTKHLTHCR